MARDRHVSVMALPVSPGSPVGRARIDVLSEMPDEWRTLLRRWERMNRSKKALVQNRSAPSAKRC